MTRRWWQQIRLWAYFTTFLLCGGYIAFVDRSSFLAFAVGGLGLILPYLEICPECGRLCWWERPGWPSGTFWIGTACRNKPGGEGPNPRP